MKSKSPMKSPISYFPILLVAIVQSLALNSTNLVLPPDFMIGVSSSAYQIEGAWNESGKGLNIWDKAVHETPNLIQNGSTGDIAADAYHQYKTDIQLLKNLGVDFYRFSIQWSRILPNGTIAQVNEEGIAYYSDLIDELLRNSIAPVVIMHHADLPQALQDIGGWVNPIMAEYFEDYAHVLYTKFGEKVKWWITINDPQFICEGYNGSKVYAPRVNAPNIGYYLAAVTLLKAHAKAYNLYNIEFRNVQNGKIGISINTEWFEAETNSAPDNAATDRALQFKIGLFTHPIFSSEGNFPSVVVETVEKKSISEGYRRSRLPRINEQEIQNIKGTHDFLGVNYYTTHKVSNPAAGYKYGGDLNVNLTNDPKWHNTTLPEYPVVPEGLRNLLNWIKNTYNNTPVFITENGYPDKGGDEDPDRIKYYVTHMTEMLKAIYEDGCSVIGYTYRSFLDGFEWDHGYNIKYGLYYVNFSDPARSRFTKNSAYVYSQITSKRELPSFHTLPNGEIVLNYTANIKERLISNETSINNNNTDTNSTDKSSANKHKLNYSKETFILWAISVVCCNYIINIL